MSHITSAQVTKRAVTDQSGDPLQDVRFSIVTIRRVEQHKPVADLVVSVERRSVDGWVSDDDLTIINQGLPDDDRSTNYVGQLAIAAVDCMETLHVTLTGHKPVGRWQKLTPPQ